MKSAAGADDDALVEQWYDDEERTILLRYLRLSAGDEHFCQILAFPLLIGSRDHHVW